MRYSITSKTAFLLVFSCALAAKTKQPPVPEIKMPAKFQHAAENGTPAAAEWWKAFSDPLLNELVEAADKNNVDLKSSLLRISESRALTGNAKAALLPSIGSSSNLSQLRGGFNQGIIRIPNAPEANRSGSFVTPFETGLVQTGVDLRWEADLFGGRRNELRASKSDAVAAEFSAEDARLLVRGEVARNYISLRGFDRQISVIKKNIALERELLELTRVRSEAGLASELDVERQTAQLASVAALVPDLDALRWQAIHRIGVLIGEAPAAWADKVSAARDSLSTPELPALIPSDLLRQRPDVRRAEVQIAAAFQRVGAAKSELYPKFVITGLSGRQATNFSGMTFGAGNFFSVGPGITLPLFSAGRIKANIAAQDARLQQAVKAYESEVLAAFEEVENAYVTKDRSELKKRDLQAGFNAAKRSVEMSTELYSRGLADFLTVLDAQRQQLLLERELTAVETNTMRAVVNLYQAIGR
jgi:outer membrane protein, multidrug efflux system